MQSGNYLRKLGIFENVSDQTLEEMWKLGNVKRYQKNRMLIRSRERENCIMILLRGKSVVYNLTHSGKRKILFILGAGQVLNDRIVSDTCSSVYCEMLEEGEVFEIPRQKLEKLMQSDFNLNRSFFQIQERKLWRLGHQLKNTIGSLYMERKLAAKLWKLSRDFGREMEEGREIDINLSMTFLADMLGSPRETVSKACHRLVREGLIKQKGKRIIVPDPEKLAAFYKSP